MACLNRTIKAKESQNLRWERCPNGCIGLDMAVDLMDHLKNHCPYRLVQCPNNCGFGTNSKKLAPDHCIMAKDYKRHMESECIIGPTLKQLEKFYLIDQDKNCDYYELDKWLKLHEEAVESIPKNVFWNGIVCLNCSCAMKQ